MSLRLSLRPRLASSSSLVQKKPFPRFLSTPLRVPCPRTTAVLPAAPRFRHCSQSPPSPSKAQARCFSRTTRARRNDEEASAYTSMLPREREKAGASEAAQRLGTTNSNITGSSSRSSQTSRSSGGSRSGVDYSRDHRRLLFSPSPLRISSDTVLRSGKLLSTPSRLLKVILPLQQPASSADSSSSSSSSSADSDDSEPLAILVHPHQPLSYLERLLQAELPPIQTNGTTRAPAVTFHAAHPGDDTTSPPTTSPSSASSDGPGAGQRGHLVRWSAATEIGDFVRDASRGSRFIVSIEQGAHISINVPSFQDRTYYLRRRLHALSAQISTQSKLKDTCDGLAQRGAQRVAVGGFVALASWWAGVWWATFHTSLGWDVMEPVTYLAGLTTVILSYLWFLYHNREVSYRSVLHMTVTRRQMKLYKERGFDIDAWEELLERGKALKREIKVVAEEYGVHWDERRDEGGGERVKRALEDKEDKKERSEGRSEERSEGGKDGGKGKGSSGEKEAGGRPGDRDGIEGVELHQENQETAKA